MCKNAIDEGVGINKLLDDLLIHLKQRGYVGHAHVNATHWYIRLTGETYPHIRQICEELGDIYSNIKMQWEDGEK